MENDSLKLNFDIALDKIETLTKHNNELLDKIEDLESKLRKLNGSNESHIVTAFEPAVKRLDDISKGAEGAIERYKHYLRKEFPSAQSKQAKRQPV